MAPDVSAATGLVMTDRLRPYQVTPTTYIANHASNIRTTSHIVAAAIVVHSNRILLLQRAPHKFVPLTWEVPGGKCDPSDETVVAAAIRELREESGLVARNVVDVVRAYQWIDAGEVWEKVTFLVEVERGSSNEGEEEPTVTLELFEHADFAWVSKVDAVADRCGDIPLVWTSAEQKKAVLEAFEVVRAGA
ncbi:Uu.00g026980.m01.CDS01 [Anthostomella pinea]|uniref:Uu.00g026980.m01.CDS01 n=1 Tax=Anthostomella pinea TaxID=933095 RepID=A0AAI8YCL9_9PEZI|nr:Uu.00g026980.m01.CDS01 [Anthostomella pinea]